MPQLASKIWQSTAISLSRSPLSDSTSFLRLVLSENLAYNHCMHGNRSSQNVMEISLRLSAPGLLRWCTWIECFGMQFVLCKLMLVTVLCRVIWRHILSKKEFGHCGLAVYALCISIVSSSLFCFTNRTISVQFRGVTRAWVTATVFLVYLGIIIARMCSETHRHRSALSTLYVFSVVKPRKNPELS